jgi:hypothetical protein
MRPLVVVAFALLCIGSCKAANLDHCLFKGEHVWCGANEPEHPYCSPCEEVGEHAGCVAEPPSEDACPDFEPPATSSGAGDTGTSTG